MAALDENTVTMSARTVALHDEPAYRPGEAAHILALPAGTVRAWSFGQDWHRDDGSSGHFHRVIEPADARARLLSFANLCELHLLAVIRRRHAVRLPQVRKAMQFMRHHLQTPRPLLSAKFKTNGVDLFVVHADQLLNVSGEGQRALRADFESALSRVETNAQGQAVRLFPYTARGAVAQLELPRAVVVDPLVSFGRPVLVGPHVRTEVIVERFDAGDAIEELAEDYRVKPRLIEEALRFERHRRVAA